MVDLSISRKLAILANLRGGPRTLGELARQFARTAPEMRKELSEIFLVELEQDGYYRSPFDLDLPDDADPEALVTLKDVSVAPSPSMTLGEVISVLALVDTLLVVADRDTAEQLGQLRQRLVEATTQAGYSSVLWPAPVRLGSAPVYETITKAIENRCYVLIEYAKSDTRSARIEQVEVGPIEIETGRHPLVVAVKNDEIRRYRLDRISSATPTERTLSGRRARALRAAESTSREGLDVTLITDLSARWVLESIPVSNWEQQADTLRISLVARPQWLGTLLVRLGIALLGIEGDDASTLIAEQYESLLSTYTQGES